LLKTDAAIFFTFTPVFTGPVGAFVDVMTVRGTQVRLRTSLATTLVQTQAWTGVGGHTSSALFGFFEPLAKPQRASTLTNEANESTLSGRLRGQRAQYACTYHVSTRTGMPALLRPPRFRAASALPGAARPWLTPAAA
jgi:hypothetical protein